MAHSEDRSSAGSTRCSCCGRGLSHDRRFQLRGVLWCLRCAVVKGPVGRRSLKVALVVGTALTAINQGNLLLAGQFPADLWWKVPLAYCVPFCVATYSALNISRS